MIAVSAEWIVLCIMAVVLAPFDRSHTFLT